MRFNKSIANIKAISFDLDDTLYDNRPIIIAAVEAMNAHLSTIPEWQAKGGSYWLECRNAVLKQNSKLAEDVTRWRQVALEWGFSTLGFNTARSKQEAQRAYQAFADARSNITVSDAVIKLLAQLRQQYHIIAITNGNVEVEKFNLRDSFDLVLRAGIDGRAKPHPELYHLACQHFDITPSQLLHVGDSLDTDVQGAHRAGCASVWLRNDFAQYQYKGLANLEIDDIQMLKNMM
ncbi:HAD-IA family hydrolase [Pseudoalteromonas piscicida]|uniref:Haloacid dehalogenase n=1 Tax=Pseudoalteromonas piscicida TaxID=43662 RepID=A0A2A5JL56_PSEO7|nr:HAD-IA family hydrolase [Pseudoalteromonas piscicida]PCK30079.1 haloacid dehalogenase [Pseudoalteromonas piscicida]